MALTVVAKLKEGKEIVGYRLSDGSRITPKEVIEMVKDKRIEKARIQMWNNKPIVRTKYALGVEKAETANAKAVREAYEKIAKEFGKDAIITKINTKFAKVVVGKKVSIVGTANPVKFNMSNTGVCRMVEKGLFAGLVAEALADKFAFKATIADLTKADAPVYKEAAVIEEAVDAGATVKSVLVKIVGSKMVIVASVEYAGKASMYVGAIDLKAGKVIASTGMKKAELVAGVSGHKSEIDRINITDGEITLREKTGKDSYKDHAFKIAGGKVVAK